MKRAIAVGAAAALVAVAVTAAWWLGGRGAGSTGKREGARTATVDATTMAPGPSPAATSPPGGTDGGVDASGPQAQGPVPSRHGVAPQPPPSAADLRARIEAVLVAERTGRVAKLACDASRCRIAIETGDLAAFAPTSERLQEVLVGLGRQLILGAPVRVGPPGAERWSVPMTLER